MRTCRSASLTLGACLVVVLGACSYGPTAEEWAGRVCAALTPWRAQISTLNAQAQREMSEAASPGEARASLLALLSGAEAASDTALSSIVAAGVPDVAGGGEVARRFIASLEGTRDAYTRARRELEALPTGDEVTFYDGVVAVLARLNAAYASSGVDTSQLESPDVRAALDGNVQCR